MAKTIVKPNWADPATTAENEVLHTEYGNGCSVGIYFYHVYTGKFHLCHILV